MISMDKVYPDEVSVDISANLKKTDTHFTMTAQCRNCDKYIGGIFLKKGTIVKDYEKSLTCKNCQVTGMMSVW